MRTAQAITGAVAFASTPHHLLLGIPTIYRARKDLDDESREVDAWAAITRGTDHPEAAVTTL